jgi:hypothetical protein
MLGPGAKGLTCATFILAVFNSVGVKLVDEEGWPIRQDEDRRFLEVVRNFATSEHLALLEQEINEGCKRIQPQEVLGACACALPATFDASCEAGAQILGKLLLGSKQGTGSTAPEG